MLEEIAGAHWIPSAVEPFGEGVPTGASGRRSESLPQSAFSDAARRWVCGLEQRVTQALGVALNRLEPWQATRYGPGDLFDYHLDCGAWACHPSGERARTLLIVMEQPVRGGATHFRALGRRIRPIAGRLVSWQNLLPTGRCNHAMIHAGCPIRQGRKTILTTWERQRPYIE